jgi:GT2 family glycosyltransferase
MNMAPVEPVSGAVLAVLVLYERSLDDAVSWPTLRALLGNKASFGLRHCLIYDNSAGASATLPASLENVSLRWAPHNPGTAGAYGDAVDVAAARGCDWLLLLDQDTALLPDYLHRAARALEDSPDAAVLVPRIWHADCLISPAIIGATGAVRPAVTPRAHAGLTTAISSGLLIRGDAMAAALPFPREIWLDYVDHWMFLALARRGLTTGLIDADLAHDLSVRSPATLSIARLSSILVAERKFHDELGTVRGVLLARRLGRALRHAAARRWKHARAIIRHTFALRTTHD